MPDVNELRFWIGLLETSTPFQISLLAAAFAALADSMQENLTTDYKDAPQRDAGARYSWHF
jgi:hypothetical protein